MRPDTQIKPDALIVGAGPVGLAMAIELSRYGLSVRIVDQTPQPTGKSKALVLWSRTLELMDRMECTPAFLAAGLKVTAANIVAGRKQIGHISLSGVATPYPFALMLPQSDTERLLEERLNAAGVHIERGVELTSFSDTSNGVVSTLRRAGSADETLTTSWLLGCDGAHSTVRHQLGIGFLGNTLASNWVLADLDLAGVPSPGEISIGWHADGILAIFPISGDRFRVIADTGADPAASPPADPTLDEVQALLDQRGPGGILASSPLWLARFHINERKVADYRLGRVFLAGDAAHIHSPAGGQGMNTGIQDAFNLAWKLALVQRGLCLPEPLLGSYSTERSAVGEQVLQGAGRMTAVAILRGEIQQSLRNHIASFVFGLSPVRRVLSDALTEVSIGYPGSPLTAEATHLHLGSAPAGPAAGQRAPIPPAQPPFGAGDTPRFALFADQANQEAANLLLRFAAIMEPNLRPPFHQGGLWLVRPDGYVALATSHDRLDEVSQYLSHICPTPSP